MTEGTSATGTSAAKSVALPQGGARLKEHFRTSLLDTLRADLKLSCALEVPRLQKIVLNMGLGRRLVQDSKALDVAREALSLIAAQKPVVTRAQRSIAAFKMREGMPVGLKVTLRGCRMYEFMDRLVTMALPRLPNYRGASPRLDGRGNYTLGIPDCTVFYEVDYNKVPYTMGLDVCFVTSTRCDDAARALLKGMGVPFVGREKDNG
jgi:large subunit ribosomal protein L5